MIDLLRLLICLRLLELYHLIYTRPLTGFEMLVFFTNSSHGFPMHLASMHFPSNRRLRLVLDGNSAQEYPINAAFPQGSILDSTLFLLYINNSPDDTICNIVVYAEDTILCSV